MADRVVVHIGLMKSGTTYVQSRLQDAGEELRGRGVLFPRFRLQALAAAEVVQRVRAGTMSAGKWPELLRLVEEWPGTVALSMEFFGPAKPEEVHAVSEALAGTDIRIVATARDLGRAVPAMWQEALKNGGKAAFADYRSGVDAQEGPGQRFWRQQGLGRIIGNWVGGFGVDRVRLVTVPPAGSDPAILWRRFCEAAELPEDLGSQPHGNQSLGAASAALLRRLNTALAGDELPAVLYDPVVKRRIAQDLLGQRRGDEQPIGYRPSREVRRRAAAITEQVTRLGVPVVGDLADLVPAPVAGVDPDRVAEADVLEAATWLLHRLVLDRVGQIRTTR